METITQENRLAGNVKDDAVVLLFAPGQRPDAGAVRRLAASSEQFAVTFESANDSDGQRWLEILANGLAFDLVGLAPGKPCTAPREGHLFGLDESFDPAACEAVAIRTGPHLGGGGTMLPVLRCLAWVAAQLEELPSLRAVAWQSAGTICSPSYFRDSVMRWIEGGPFPGLGLTALVPQPDGAIISEGLSLFTGQELRLEANAFAESAEGAKLALRLLHWLVESGKVLHPQSLTGPSGETLMLEPEHGQGIVRVWRGSR